MYYFELVYTVKLSNLMRTRFDSIDFVSIRLISIRLISIRFDSIRFDSVRFRFGTH